MFKKDYTPQMWMVYSTYARLVQHLKINVIHYINTLKKSHMITLTDAEKAFETLQYKFMIKNSWETRIKRKLPELDKGHLQKPTALIL